MRLVIQAYFYLPSYIITSLRIKVKDEQNTCSNETAEINVGHGHSVALFSTHLVSKCPCHPSVDRYQIGASSVGMCHSALVPFPCQARAEGARSPCLAPSWLSWQSVGHTAAQLRLSDPGSGAPEPCTTQQSKRLVPGFFK